MDLSLKRTLHRQIYNEKLALAFLIFFNLQTR